MRIYPHVCVTGYATWVMMRSQATSPPLAVTVLAALCVGLSRCGASESPGPRCDNGKLSLDRDLPTDAVHWDCSTHTWPESTQTLPSIETVHDPEPARHVCMDKPISYNHSIPNSGAFRPVKAESGEYVYCPPQRWLNNLHLGATVLLHHPCVPFRERHLLSGLARCLPGYIVTSHPQLSRRMPIALVSWGRTLELAAVASADICDWLLTTKTPRNESDDETRSIKYNLLLTRPAGLHQQEHSTIKKDSLRRCCEEAISSMPRGAGESEPRMDRKRLMGINEGSKNREKRAVIREMEENNNKIHNTTKVLDFSNKNASQNHISSLGADSTPEKRTFSDPSFSRQAQDHSSWPTAPLVSNVSKSTLNTDSVRLRSSKSESGALRVQTEAQPSHKEADDGNSKHNSSAGPEVLAVAPKDEGTNSADSAKHSKVKDNEVVDVEEREVEHEPKHSPTHTRHKAENTGFEPASKTQAEPRPVVHGDTKSKDCDGCQASVAEAHATAADRGFPRTPRSDEAVWAAAALGFLLVLLTLSVLHTRLYRHWRTTPSLYWHDPRQDYDSVADVIRRRLRIAKRRKKRGRRQECVLLPSSSSSDEHP